MTPTIEDAIEIVRQLPLDDREKLREWIHEENQKQQTEKEKKKADLENRDKKFKKALKWIEDHKEEFDGQWVVLDGDKLISHGTDAKTVYDEARSKGINAPFLERLKAKILPFGGW